MRQLDLRTSGVPPAAATDDSAPPPGAELAIRYDDVYHGEAAGVIEARRASGAAFMQRLERRRGTRDQRVSLQALLLERGEAEAARREAVTAKGKQHEQTLALERQVRRARLALVGPEASLQPQKLHTHP